MKDDMSGRSWARGGFIASMIISLVGNVAHTYLLDSTVSLWLRVPGALIWPGLLFVGIEVIIRIKWQRRVMHGLARTTLLFAAVPAAITSYEHLHALLLLMGERPFVAGIGPLAVDGTMIGCTLALLFTRPVEALPDVNLDDIIARWNVEPAPVIETWKWEPSDADLRWAGEMLKPEPKQIEKVKKVLGETMEGTREKVAALCLIQGEKVSDVAARTGIGQSTLYRYSAAIRHLSENPDQELPETIKLRDEVVQFIRDELKTREKENA